MPAHSLGASSGGTDRIGGQSSACGAASAPSSSPSATEPASSSQKRCSQDAGTSSASSGIAGGHPAHFRAGKLGLSAWSVSVSGAKSSARGTAVLVEECCLVRTAPPRGLSSPGGTVLAEESCRTKGKPRFALPGDWPAMGSALLPGRDRPANGSSDRMSAMGRGVMATRMRRQRTASA